MCEVYVYLEYDHTCMHILRNPNISQTSCATFNDIIMDQHALGPGLNDQSINLIHHALFINAAGSMSADLYILLVFFFATYTLISQVAKRRSVRFDFSLNS